jgi:membrane-associated phospholipid phosphatase
LIAQVYSLDLSVFRLINRGFNHPILDQFFNLLADGRFWTPILILAAVYLVLRGKDRTKAWVILTILSVAIGDPLISNPLKHFFHRPRPYQSVEGVREVSPGSGQNRWTPAVRLSAIPESEVSNGRSFPSSHVANAVAAATSARLVWGPSMRWPWIVVALAALGRVYTGDHYPTDVLASIPLSILYTWVIAQILNRVWVKVGPLSFPKLFARLPSFLHSR